MHGVNDDDGIDPDDYEDDDILKVGCRKPVPLYRKLNTFCCKKNHILIFKMCTVPWGIL